MIEQTEFVVTDWNYTPPDEPLDPKETVSNFTSLDVMKKQRTYEKRISMQV